LPPAVAGDRSPERLHLAPRGIIVFNTNLFLPMHRLSKFLKRFWLNLIIYIGLIALQSFCFYLSIKRYEFAINYFVFIALISLLFSLTRMLYLFFIVFTSIKYKKWKILIGAIVHFVFLIIAALISQFVLLMSLGVGISAGEPY
jgi:hypothetical protein